MKIIVTCIIVALATVVSMASDRGVIVRDRYGNIMETKEPPAKVTINDELVLSVGPS